MYFCGTGDAMEPICSQHAVADKTIKTIGHLFAASICNYGPSPNFIAPWIFNYFVGGMDKVLEELPDSLQYDQDSQTGDLQKYFEVYNNVSIVVI